MKFMDVWWFISWIIGGVSKGMSSISDNQIIVALVSAFITGILALRLGKELYQ
jgi:photosystem I reaction center subunit XII